MSSSETFLSTRSRNRRQARRTAQERRLFLRFVFVWVGSLAALALAWYTRTSPL